MVNDTDPNANPQLNAGVVSGPSHGTLTFGTDGSFQYDPTSGFQGIDRFNYQVYDLAGMTYGNTVTVTLYSHGGALVSKIYQQMLNRPAADSDIAYWSPNIDSGAWNMGTVVSDGSQPGDGLYNSDEYLKPQITTFYQKFLGTTPDPGGLSYWEGQWVAYHGPEQVIIGIASTAACYSFSGGNNTSWVTLMYNVILNRAPDSGGLNYFVSELNNGYMSRQQVVQTLVTGGEYRGDVIQSFFQMYLNRAASSSDVNYYQSLFNAGYSQMQIQQNIVQSAEYTGNPQAAPAGSVFKWA